MSTARSQHAINLGDIERQIRDSSSNRQPKHSPQDDPLAELARIISGEPVQRQEPSLELPRIDSKAWPSDFTPPSSHAQASLQDTSRSEIEDDISRLLRGEEPQSEGAPDELEDAMRSLDELLKERETTMAQSAAAPARLPKADSFEEWELRGSAAASSTATRREPEFDFDSAFAGSTAPAQSGAQSEWDRDDNPSGGPAPAPARNRKPIALVAAVVGVAALGVGAALSMKGAIHSMTSARAPLIVADKGPSKVAPANPGGMQIPDQNKLLFERSAGDPKPPAKMVNNEEQPMDLRDAVRRETGVSIAPAAASPASQSQSSSSTADPARAIAVGAPEPRKVKTVVVKPPQPAPVEPLPPPRPPAAASAVGSIDTPNTAGASAPKVKTPGSLTASRETTASIRTTAPRQATASATGQQSAPLPITPATPTPQRAAAIEPNPLTGSSTPVPPVGEGSAPASRLASTGGGFVVQLASEGSEQSAKAAITRLQARYAELGSYSSSIQRREVNGQQRYRIRFGNMSRDGAGSLCSALKGKGQDCLVQPQ